MVFIFYLFSVGVGVYICTLGIFAFPLLGERGMDFLGVNFKGYVFGLVGAHMVGESCLYLTVLTLNFSSIILTRC